MKKGWMVLLVFVGVLGFSGVSSATLSTIGTATYLGNDYNLIYEDDLDLVWLDYTSQINSWQNQVDWATGLNAAGVLTYNLNSGIGVSWLEAWRLPETVDGESVFGYNGTTTAGYNITTSEMGYLYYTSLGNLGTHATDGTYPQLGWGLQKTGDFDNLLAYFYWSGTEYSADPNLAWLFDFDSGFQGTGPKGPHLYALAVRPGEVYFTDGNGNGTDPHFGDGNGTDPAPVPEPATMLLLGTGLIGLAGLKRKIKKS